MDRIIEKIVKSASTPNSKEVLWLDTSAEQPVLKHFISGSWEAVAGGGGGGTGAVDSVNGQTGVVVLDAEDVGAATAAQGAKADTALQEIKTINGNSLVGSGNIVTTEETVVFDGTPTQGSINGVTSGGVASALDAKATLDVEYASTIITLTFASYYIKDDGTSSTSGYHAEVNVSAGEVYYIRDIETQLAYAATPLLLKNSDGTYTPLDYSTSAGKRYVSNVEVVVPNGATKLIVNSRYSSETYQEISKRTKKNVISYANVGNEINSGLFPIKQELADTDIETVENSNINSTTIGNAIVFANNSGYNRLVISSVNEGEQYYIAGYTGSIAKNFAITTNSGIVVAKNADGAKDSIVTIPKYGGKIHINIDKGKGIPQDVIPPIMKIVGYKPHEHNWRDYKWAAIGDSLTDSSINAKVKYPRFIKLMTGIQYQELGVGGTGYWRTSSGNDTYGDRAAQVASDTDIITFFGSINDWRASGNDIPNGNPSDTISDNTLSGYMNHAIDVAMETAPNAMIVLVSHMYFKGISETRQEELVATLKGVAEYRQLPFVDMYHSTMFKRILDATWAEDYTTDYSSSAETYGHPSILAHLRLITPRFVEILAKYMPLHNPEFA